MDKRRRRRCLLLAAGSLLLLILTLAVVVAVAVFAPEEQRSGGGDFKSEFMRRCENVTGNCSQIWAAFERAYVGKDPCEVPVEAYDSFIAAAPLKPACNRMMFWSKTKDMVHDFTKEKNCFVTLEDTVWGYVLDGLTWCGREGSSETFTDGCPGWTECEKNPVRSFWKRASATFADAACGDVTAMLNGSISTPFHPASIFATVEVKRFKPPAMKSLTVLLVAESAVANCADASLTDLQKELDKGIKYNCKEVTEAHIKDCMSHKEKPCGPCW